MYFTNIELGDANFINNLLLPLIVAAITAAITFRQPAVFADGSRFGRQCAAEFRQSIR